MHKIFILNAISLNLVNGDKVDFMFAKSSVQEVKNWCKNKEVISAVRHGLEFIAKDIASEACLFKQTSEIKLNRGAHDVIIIQYRGPRLPEGATSLPNGAKLEIWEGIIRIYQGGKHA